MTSETNDDRPIAEQAAEAMAEYAEETGPDLFNENDPHTREEAEEDEEG